MDPPVKPEGERWETGWRPVCLPSLLLAPPPSRLPSGSTGGSRGASGLTPAGMDCPVDPPVEPEEDNGGQR